MFLLIDNYDSFTYNLVQAFQVLGQPPVVLKNDDPEILKLAESGRLSRVCLSPGPGRPEEAGLSPEFLRLLDQHQPDVPLLGVCLGHQLLGAFGGGEIYVAARIMHGKTSPILHDGRGLFSGLPEAFEAGRYNSLLVRPPAEGGRLLVTARTEEDEVMGLRFTDRPWVGIQFHPESVLTPKGPDLLANFFQIESGGRLDEDFKAGRRSSPFPDDQIRPEHLMTDQGPIRGVKTAAFDEPPIRLPLLMETVADGGDLSREMAAQLFSRLMDGELNPSQAGALLMGLRAKGETPVEMAEAARAVLKRAIALPPLPGPVLDVVGTGGDGQSSFNCSTATALVMAGLGYKVVKHGNRSISSRSGSADVLELLGVDLNSPPERVPELLAKHNFAFLFAPNYHPAFSHIMPVRKEMGIRTLFNILGPLVNPAKPAHSFLGAHAPEAAALLAGALADMDTVFSAAVHGAGGYDEMTTMGPATVYLVEGERVSQMSVDPARYGFRPARPEELVISGPKEGVAVLRELLAGRGPEAMRDMLMLNVAMAIYVMRGAQTFDDCLAEARRAVGDGVGQQVLEKRGS